MPKERMSFGNWTFRPETLVLRHEKAQHEVDLEQCTTSAEVLDWICQVAEQVDGGVIWAPKDLSDLVLGHNTLLRPQASLCRSGIERGPIKNIKSLVESNTARRV